MPASFWTEPQLNEVAGTSDPELYRYGVYGREFTAYFTVAPEQIYHVRLKFCQARKPPDPGGYTTSIQIGDKPVAADMDIAATAGGLGKAIDLVVNDVRPQHGVIAIRFLSTASSVAMIQAIEVGPGNSAAGAKPVVFSFTLDMNHLADPGFEDLVPGMVGSNGESRGPKGKMPWNCRFLGPSKGVVWNEADFAIHPEAGLPNPRTGKNALRTHSLENDAHTQVYQDVPIVPQTAYRASVWVQAVDLHGKGFGTHAGDSAGLRMIEMDASGKILVEHPTVAVTKSGGYKELSQSFTTTKNTAKVRFLLETVIACRHDQGHVTYDDCSLIRQLKLDHPPHEASVKLR